MNIALNEKQMNLTYAWKGIQLLMTDRGIEMKTDAKSVDVLIQMEEIYKHLYEVLPLALKSHLLLNRHILRSEYCQ